MTKEELRENLDKSFKVRVVGCLYLDFIQPKEGEVIYNRDKEIFQAYKDGKWIEYNQNK
jgi:hypothetical protein